MNENPNIRQQRKPSLWALSPLLVFLCLYLVVSLLVNDFYKVPITVAFVVSSVYALFITRGITPAERVTLFSQGASNKNIMLMLWIFILAGAFAQSAQAMGAVDATVNLTLHLLPDQLLLAGIFLAACFISTSVGTSVGTIVALTPVALGLAEKTGVDMPFMVAIVVGGAFFGDNLSFISDTTIASTQTLGCEMRDKFRVNSRIVMPAAIVVFLFYIIEGYRVQTPDSLQQVEWVKVIPYVIVLVTALMGVNVMLVLLLGIVSTGLLGMLEGGMDFFGWFGAMGQGISGMGELIIITLLAGGMLELIRYIANCCTANNTIAIITVGPIAKDITEKFHLDPRKSASLLDTFSCLVQGIIPYGAQMLMAAELASLSPLSIIRYLYYPFCMGIMALLCIFFRYPKRYS